MGSILFGTRNQTTQAVSPQQNPQLDPKVQEMYQRLKNSSNPNAELNSMIANNPNLVRLAEMGKFAKGDFRSVFLMEAKRKGVDPRAIFSLFN